MFSIPEEGVLFPRVVHRRRQLHLRVLLQVALDGAEPHGGEDEQHREQNLRDQTLPVPSGVMNTFEEHGHHLLNLQRQTVHPGVPCETCVEQQT